MMLTAFLLAGLCTPSTIDESWKPTVLVDAKTKLGGCAIGELIAGNDAPEVVAVAGDGGVWLAQHGEGGWSGTRVASLPGEAIQCAVGDADPRFEGNEIVCVGMAKGKEDDGGQGAAHIVRRDGDKWIVERVFTVDALLHGVAIAPDGFFATGFTNEVFHLKPTGEFWSKASIVDLPAPGKNVITTAGQAIAVACNDGSLVVASSGAGGWTARVANRREAGRARLAFHDNQLLVADDDGALSLIGPGGPQTIVKTKNKLRGAAFAELDPRSEGLELATAGYGGEVFVASRSDNRWTERVVHTQSERFHHLAAANLDGQAGDELVVCGYSGELLMLQRPSTENGEK